MLSSPTQSDSSDTDAQQTCKHSSFFCKALGADNHHWLHIDQMCTLQKALKIQNDSDLTLALWFYKREIRNQCLEG
jgi:hypothetical protein